MDNMISLKITQNENEAYISLPAETLDFSKATAIQITDCVCPMLKGMDIKCEDISSLNNFAVQLRQISDIGKLPKLNAVLSANQCSSIDQAITLAERLEHFNLDAQIPRRIFSLLCVLLIFIVILPITAFAEWVTISTVNSPSYFLGYNSKSEWHGIGTPAHYVNETGAVAYCMHFP